MSGNTGALQNGGIIPDDHFEKTGERQSRFEPAGI